MHSYYKKILIWLFLNSIITGCLTYIVTGNVKQTIVLTSGQSTILLTLYPVYEYYYTWTPYPFCPVIDE
tara:strand:+ start:7981 stop:8187 length:207 start_codon:yes stop_codon:yes gene_type:complete